ncbi:MAG: 5-(carboxyamino)imidazole ribonucleotide synthase [Acidobacteria bacterium]|nr:5-(carboxyamino)imidazole ribonucleotide synthase [Acidobacteriota bacterium]
MVLPGHWVGIVGGGQLARMMLQKVHKLGLRARVLDPDPACPAAALCDDLIVGSPLDRDALRSLVERCQVSTLEIEHVDAGALIELEAAGHAIHPSPRLVATLQDKLLQRRALERAGIPGPRFAPLPAGDLDALSGFGFPLVQKARRGGYDGRGVAVLRSPDDLTRALPGECLAEELVPIDKELAIIVARGRDGALRSYPVVEMVFDPRAHVLDVLLVPARIDERLARDARALAEAAIAAQEGVGVFGVELFLDRAGRLLVNEIAARPHNSGHYTIEAAATCQFEQHLRAVAGLPLGSTELLRPAAMVNLLGSESGEGRPHVHGLIEALALEGVSFHFYGKSTTRPRRKMGHVTVVAPSVDEALRTALHVRQLVRIDAEDRAAPAQPSQEDAA